jgi:rhamnosyltransferase subunit B
MHVVLASLGTDGDVFPYIGLGRRLRERGHRITLVTGERYERWARELGFDFVSMATEAEVQDVLGNPDLWHPWKCALVIGRWGAQLIERQYQVMAPLVDRDDVVLVTNPGVLAARMLHEQRGTPLASVILQPWVIPSITAPPKMPIPLPRWAPHIVGKAYWRLFHTAAHHVIAGDVNRMRRSVGLPPLSRVFEWWLSPQRVIGLFPDWYGPPQLDWPEPIRLTGFPLYDGGLEQGLPNDVREFLDAGPPPVAVTFGTGMMHARQLFADAVAACERLNLRGLLLTRHAEQLPAHLPATIRQVSFAAFRSLFPRCAAVVHHGGIGTTSQALAAGTPQLILPFAFDQPDNGVRVQNLGAGAWLPPRRRNASRIADALASLTMPAVRERCEEVAQRFAAVDGLTRAAEEVEALEV